MSKFQRFYLPLFMFVAILSVGDVYASADTDDDKQTASSSSSASSDTPTTDTLSQEAINKLSATSAVEAYAKINQNWHYAKPEETLTTQSSLWEAKYYTAIINDGGENKTSRVPTVVPKDGIDFGPALVDLVNKPARLECTIALSTVKATCLQSILGKHFEPYVKAFKRIATKLGWTKDDLLHEICLPLMTIKHGDEAIPGTITYITNISHYLLFKPGGNARGSNVVKVSDDKFIGFSACYHDGPTLLEAIEAQDWRLFSDTSDVEYESAKHARYVKLFSDNPGSFVKSRREYQTKVQFCDYFDAAKIQRFISKGEIEINEVVYS